MKMKGDSAAPCSRQEGKEKEDKYTSLQAESDAFREGALGWLSQGSSNLGFFLRVLPIGQDQSHDSLVERHAGKSTVYICLPLARTQSHDSYLKKTFCKM